MTPLEKARKRQQENNSIYTCHDCKNCVKVGGWWYCEDSGKMLHPMMLERTSPIVCKRSAPKEEADETV